ncbi:hypothetical protein B0T45_09885 [Chromobacterium haemolyticum]|uniref:Flagellar assembly protein FliH n=1 Tax=Chromobacterium haemolyticum TaxID=394935 RepID=A0A1W0D112_9NEIS|nr:hypothetical protein B0T45_09885 [Chromobacterium haemolyticum]
MGTAAARPLADSPPSLPVRQPEVEEIEAMRARAMAEIEAARAKCQAECEELRAAARQNGYREGMAQAEVESLRLREALSVQGKAMLAALGGIREAVHDEVERMLMPLLLEALARMIGEMPLSAELARSCVRSALREASGREPVRVRLHPADAALLAGDDVVLSEAGREVCVVADASLDGGGCIVETMHGDIDARMTTQMERLRRSLQEARAR